jgi:purine-nucleoside phosphorylase
LRNLFDPSSSVLKPTDIVMAFTTKNLEELQLPRRAIITFNNGDLRAILNNTHQKPIKAWTNFRNLFRITNSETIVSRCYFGGPNIAALVEELSAFGVREFVLWGYCGGISGDISIGDVLIAEGALRHDGVSYHYLNSNDEFVYSSWFPKWRKTAIASGIIPSLIWSCDALYRETRNKINMHKKMGIHAVEMEVASFFAVCKAKKLKGIAFLVVSDLFRQNKWKPGFSGEPFKEGTRRLREFILEQGILH